MRQFETFLMDLRFVSVFICVHLWLNSPIPILAADKPIPIILDTDIGTDVDDAYALVLAARSPRLDLRAVTTVYAKVDVRAAIARKLLLLMGKDQVPVAAGDAKALDGHEYKWAGWEGKGLLEADEKVPGISPKPASTLIAEVLKQSADKITLVSVGGLTNIAVALRDDPTIKQKVERIVIMGGCVQPIVIEGKRIPDRMETNLHNDVDAAKIVLESGLPITLVPAEMTFRTKLLRGDYERIQASTSPLCQSMVRMSKVWEAILKGFAKNSGIASYYDDGVVLLHDPLAVATLIEPAVAKTERQRIRLEVGKRTIRTIADPAGPIAVDLVVSVDVAKLSRMVTESVIAKSASRD